LCVRARTRSAAPTREGTALDGKGKAQRLLDAQVGFLKAQISGDRFVEFVNTEVDHALATAAKLTLGQVVTRDQIKATAYKYATQMRIQGSIPELVGEIAQRLYDHRVNDENRVDEVIDQRQFQELVGKLTEMQAFRHMLDRLYESPLTANWASWFLYRIVTDTLDRNRALAERVPGVAPLLAAGGRIAGTVVPEPGRVIDLRIREFAERGVRFLLQYGRSAADAADDAQLFDAAMDLWDDHAGEAVGSFRELMSPEDVEDLLVIIFEFWLSFRDTDYFRSLLYEGVDSFFDKYAEVSLRDLLDELGIGRDDMVEEALRFGPPIIELLKDNGMLDSLLRRRLEPFFFSDDVLAILE